MKDASLVAIYREAVKAAVVAAGQHHGSYAIDAGLAEFAEAIDKGLRLRGPIRGEPILHIVQSTALRRDAGRHRAGA